MGRLSHRLNHCGSVSWRAKGMSSQFGDTTLAFTTFSTLSELSYYEGDGEPRRPAEGQFAENPLGPWRAVVRDYGYGTTAQYEAGLQAFRRQYGLAPGEPVWVLDGGWGTSSGPADPNLPFTRAVRVFQDRSR